MNDTAREVATQPDLWQRGIARRDEAARVLNRPGARMLILGCGTSWFVAQSLAVLREAAGLGETDAVCASEYGSRRRYDAVVAISRSGTSTEVLDAMRRVPAGAHRASVTATPDQPLDALVDDRLLLDFADERSVVQTRYPTTVLAMARAAYGENVEHLVADGAAALAAPLPADPGDVEHVVFLGTGWTVGLANEAAL